MKNKIAIITDSNSGILPAEAKSLEGVFVLPMPVIVDGDTFYEEIDFTQERFYAMLDNGKDMSTSQPSPNSVTELWDEILKDYDEIIHIPMSSGLSGSYQSAHMLAEDYDGRVFVVNNRRISVTLRRSVYDAVMLREAGRSGEEIYKFLEEDASNSSIYIMLDTLYYLKKGGRITPAAAALGTLLKLKPVLQIQGDKLDAYSKARTSVQGKQTMINAIKADMVNRFGGDSPENISLDIAYTKDPTAAFAWREELKEVFPGYDIHIDPLSLSISCHIGPGALALAASRKIKI